jgi:FtsZ-binding cell division protein ZapB
MISLDQILLLEQKVESAVEKITQLQVENDALRSKCSELSNAVSNKSEQLSSFEKDQNKIENGILKALDRLNSIENTVLNAAPRESSSSLITTEAVPSSGTASTQKPAEKPSLPYQTTAEESAVNNKTDTKQASALSRPAEKQANFDIF